MASPIVWTLFQALFEVSIGRRGPEQLPASTLLLALIAGVYFSANVVFASLLGANLAIARSAVDLAASLVFLWSLLALFEQRQRFSQTASAFLGVGTVLTLVALPLASSLASSAQEGSLGLAEFTVIGLQLWWFGIVGGIVSKAIAKPYVVGLGLVIVFWLGMSVVITELGAVEAP